MNRRDFAKSLAAMGLLPALPAMPATAAATAPAYTPYMYGLGAHFARRTGQCSPDLLMRHLRIAPEAARAMQAQLTRSGIVSAANTAGLARAAQPYMRSAAPAMAAGGQNAGDAVRKIAKVIAGEHDDIATVDHPGQEMPDDPGADAQ